MSIKSPIRNKNTAQSRRQARFIVDLSFPMIFCAAEAILLLASLVLLDSFFESTQNGTALSAVIFTFFAIYLVTAGTI